MKNIVIVGAGELGKEVVWLIEEINKVKPTYLILGYLDDVKYPSSEEYYGYPILGKISDLEKLYEKNVFSAVLALQDVKARKRIVEAHQQFNSWETIIHPLAVIASTTEVGEGSIIFPRVTMSVDSHLGKFGLYYIQATICNDCNIGDYVSVMAGTLVLERVTVGSESYISAGSRLYPNVKLENNVYVPIGCTVTEDYHTVNKNGFRQVKE